MISLAYHVYRAGDDLNKGEPLKTLIIGPVESLTDEEDPEQDVRAFGEDIFKEVDDFEGDLDIVVEIRRIPS